MKLLTRQLIATAVGMTILLLLCMVLLLDDSQCRWCTLWLYNTHLKLSGVNQVSLSILLQFLTLFQRYLARLVRYSLFADFYSHNSEESSF